MQSKDDMAVSLMSMTPEAEELLLDRIEAEVQREQAARDQLNAKRDQRTRQRQDIQNEREKVHVQEYVLNKYPSERHAKVLKKKKTKQNKILKWRRIANEIIIFGIFFTSRPQTV